jgi:hypothetical protein
MELAQGEEVDGRKQQKQHNCTYLSTSSRSTERFILSYSSTCLGFNPELCGS